MATSTEISKCILVQMEQHILSLCNNLPAWHITEVGYTPVVASILHISTVTEADSPSMAITRHDCPRKFQRHRGYSSSALLGSEQ